jgi:hypothetical protein
MTQSAVAFKDTFNGYEQRTDGLWVHRGKADFGSLRATNTLPPISGQGLEVSHVPGPSGAGYIVAYDRDIAAYRDLNLVGKNVTLSTLGGGKLGLPANSVQQLIGNVGSSTWSTTTVTAWVATALTTSVTTGGGMLRVEVCFIGYHSVAGGQWLTGLGWDGVVQVGMSQTTTPVANYGSTVSWVDYVTLPSGAHTVTVFAYNYTAGTLGIVAGVASTLFVTEQKA